jgi:hypothetical protein
VLAFEFELSGVCAAGVIVALGCAAGADGVPVAAGALGAFAFGASCVCAGLADIGELVCAYANEALLSKRAALAATMRILAIGMKTSVVPP